MLNTSIDMRKRGEDGFWEKFKFLHPPTVPPSSRAVGQAPHSSRKVVFCEGAVGNFFLAFGRRKPISVRGPVWFLPFLPTRVNGLPGRPGHAVNLFLVSRKSAICSSNTEGLAAFTAHTKPSVHGL